MTSHEIRRRFLTFFEKRGHAILPSASLIPENDPSVLFNTAGMQPLVPYLLGEKHPRGTRLANVQKCVRTVDIDEIGDNTHCTFFEMLGNWSLGDYFKEDAIRWSYEFLTSKEEGLNLDPKRLYVTVFEGDRNAPRDEEASKIWKKLFEENGVFGERIYFLGASSNWWSAGENGPCGPDTEMFYDVTGKLTDGLTKEAYLAADDRQDVVEIWNDVFMEYEKRDGTVIGTLANQNVDTGSGLERVAMIMQGKNNVFDTDVFAEVFAMMRECETKETGDSQSAQELLRAERIMADHIRTAVFLAGDGVVPSNKDQGYVLRRLIRRGIRLADKHMRTKGIFSRLSAPVLYQYRDAYAELFAKGDYIQSIIAEEERSFSQALEKGDKELRRRLLQCRASGECILSGKDAFEIFSTYGFPLEMTQEIAQESGVAVDVPEFEREFARHQTLSNTASAGKFKGGLADTGVLSVRYHTATHLVQQALRQVLGEHVLQKGSNITAERMRFDFSHPSKMTPEEIKSVEAIVNRRIAEAMPVSYTDMPIDAAKASGAIGLFDDKYGETVRVYSVGDFSKELCGGPHVANTSELGHFKIVKEEASSSGVRRIKAVLK
jgi:alanyl-tRNA synthetase